MNNSRPQSKKQDIDPDEIFLDSSNLPNFDIDQFEGKLEKPISFSSMRIIGLFVLLVLSVFTAKLFSIQIVNGEEFHTQSEENRLRHSIILSERGVITDRNDIELAWNDLSGNTKIPQRRYTDINGLGHLLGYTKPPAKDSSGEFYRVYFEGISGVEALFNSTLQGENGTTIVETNVHGETISQNLIQEQVPGENIILSIDAEVSEKLYERLKNAATEYGYTGGASVIMDIDTGELLALTSYPEVDSNILSEGGDSEAIEAYANNQENPYLNRALNGTFTPGSIVKPFIATGILEEELIHPTDNILSDGALEVENPYDENVTYVFRDWRAHGLVNMREAIAHSSDQYFYVLGGGYENIEGLGINKINHYMNLFGFGSPTGIRLGNERSGVVPSPQWKQSTFNEQWYLGNTYHTSIGQYGFLVTPLQMVRATAALANRGRLITPRVAQNISYDETELPVTPENLSIVREGMRLGVREGTARSLDISDLAIAAKTGTAEVGSEKGFENSWVIGFFPYEDPQYAFATVLEHAPEEVSFGAAPAMRPFFDWLVAEKPRYIQTSEFDDE